MPGKQCSGCGEMKGVEAFSRDRSRKDGLQSQCKACDRRYREVNREAIAERQRRYREANREASQEYFRRYREANREAIAESRRRYREANREAMREWRRNYYEANREAIAESRRRYCEANREAIAERERRRYAESRDMTREAATRTGEPYTPAEDAHILTSDEPVAVIAVELGRTLNSVNTRRKILRKNVTA